MTATTKTDCTTTGLCQYDSLTRTKFFDGMLLTDESLQADQTYHREALKRVNRYLWGAGIVCGLEVEWVSGLCIRVSPGVALDCKGNLIELCRCITVDLTKECRDANPGGCISPDATPIERYLVVRYADTPADLQPVQTSDDECASSGQRAKCQPSKTREGFCLELREQCTETPLCPEDAGMVAYLMSQARARAAKEMEELAPPPMKLSPPCPECGCTDSYVGLAKLTIDCGKSSVVVTTECRSYVWTPGLIRLILCKLLAGLDRKLNQDAPVAAWEQPIPSVNDLLRRPQEAVVQGLKHYARYPEAPDRVAKMQEEIARLWTVVEGIRSRGPGKKPPPEAPPG